MRAYASYIIVLNGNSKDIEAATRVLADAFDEKSFIGENQIEIEDTDVIVMYGDIKDLAIDMAEASPSVEFSIRGTIDTSESAGEYMDFLFEYKGGKLSDRSSEWYVLFEADEYDSYEEFCEAYDGFSKEEFECYREKTHYILNSGCGEIVSKVPLGDPAFTEIVSEKEETQEYKTESNPDGFVIENGVLTEYHGNSERVVFPDEITEIAGNFMNGVFNNHGEIKDVILPKGLKVLGAAAFCGCSGLKTIVIPKGITCIDDWAFNSCDNLEGIELPEGLDSIGWMAFAGCRKLKFINLGEKVTRIGEDAFVNCRKLTIIGKAGSYVEQYAKNNNIRFEAK